MTSFGTKHKNFHFLCAIFERIPTLKKKKKKIQAWDSKIFKQGDMFVFFSSASNFWNNPYYV